MTASRRATERPRVTALLDSLAERRLVCVVGDAASGKSRAVRDWAAGREDPVATVVPAPTSDRPRDLLAAFVDATEPWCPGLRDALEPELAATAAGAPADDPTGLAAVLAGALSAGWAERASGPFTVVLDSLDTVGDPAGVAFVADLVRLFPRTVHMIVVARRPPPFAVRRLDAAGEYGELGPRALRFEADETAALFAAAGLELDADAARALTEACGGWAGGLRLAVEAALGEGVEGLVERLGRSSAPALLAAVALTPLDDATRGTVRAMSVLGRIERDVTSGRPDVVDRLDRLSERGLLIAADGAGWTLTALARHAVETEMPPDPAAVREVLVECVAMAVAAGCAEPAIRWAARVAEPDLVRTTVAAVGAAVVDSGSDVLADAAECLPVPVGDVVVDGLLSSYFACRGDLPRALAHLGDGGAALPVAIGWRVASALWMHGDAAGAQAVADRCRGEAPAPDMSQLEGVRATLAWGRGDGPAARAHADDCLALARQSGEDAALGTAWVVQALVAALEGDMNRNQRCYATALVHAIAAHDVLTQLRVRCNVGSRLTEIGRCREAVVELDDAVRLGEATGQRTRAALARLNQGQARLGLGQLDEALVDVDAALAMWVQIDSPMAAYAHQARADVLARRGDVTRAVGAYRAALTDAEEQQDAQTIGPALAGLARCLATDDLAEALRVAERATDERAALGSVAALLARGWLLRLAGDPAASAAAREARDEAARREDPLSLSQALVLDVLCAPEPVASDGRLSEARALAEEVGDVIALAELDLVVGALGRDHAAQARARARLRALGVRDSAALIAGPLAVLHQGRDTVVEIRTLGAFGVRVADAAVPSSAWQSRKARDLVKILASRRGRPITRDALADLLWPDSDGSGNRLSVALSTARAVFDPAKKYPPDRVIVADRNAVRLDLQTVALDLDTYLASSEHALSVAARGDAEGVALLTSAAAAYGGDFCEEDPYEAWAASTRDEARARQQQVVRTLAEQLVGAGRHDDAVPWWIALLGLDPYDESGHLDLIRTLVRVGRHGEARRSYRTYLERMDEMDVEPAAFPQRGGDPQDSRRPPRTMAS